MAEIHYLLTSGLVRRMLALLDELYAVDVVCDPNLQPFYARFGMQPATAMSIRRLSRQAGGAVAP